MTKIQPKDRLKILDDYINVVKTTENIAKDWGVTPRSIQRIVKKYGASRTVAEANKVTAHLKDYSGMRVPDHLKVHRKSLPLKTRYEIMMEHKFCQVCGNTPDVLPLEIDHIDNNPENNEKKNLQVLCTLCNKGKAYAGRVTAV